MESGQGAPVIAAVIAVPVTMGASVWKSTVGTSVIALIHHTKVPFAEKV